MRARVQMSSRLLKNALHIKLNSDSNTVLQFNLKLVVAPDVSANAKLLLLALKIIIKTNSSEW